jgi:peptidoglycan/LPS O-acetylase OafA/YrhL
MNYDINIEQLLKKENNNFNFIRLTAAIAVIFGHSFALFNSDYKEPISIFLKFTHIAELSVNIFFFISGILITSSFLNSKSIADFILKRIARIWPGLTICLIITVFILGSFCTTISLNEYFYSPQTRHYLKENFLLYVQFNHLPGVFEKNHYPNSFNSSLWTLPIEIRAYLFVFITGLIGLLKDRKAFLYTSILIFFCFLFFDNCLSYFFIDLRRVHFFLFFVCGMLFYLFREKIIINPILCLVLIGIWLAYKRDDNGFSQFLFYISFIYFILYVSQTKLLLNIKLTGDYSYGVYIYGFVIQQTIAFLFPKLTAYNSMIFTIPITLILAILSWHFIEKPSLDYVHRYLKHERKII